MDYTISALANLAGISTRTLRYYNEIGLLVPKGVTAAGYRMYGQAEVDALQQILFYRALGVGLREIKTIMTAPNFERHQALESHLQALLKKQEELGALIASVRKTIAFEKGETTMTNEEKFEGFKQQLIDENEERYGKEIRALYGDDTIDASNRKIKGMTRESYQRMETLEREVNETLKQAVTTQDPAGELAQKACELHKQWLLCTWSQYSREAHKGLAQMYVGDARFKAYYDKISPGCAEFLRDAIMIYCG